MIYHQQQPDQQQAIDIITLVTAKTKKFSIRYALLVLSTVWFTTGAVLATNLITTNAPPKFPLCGANGLPVLPPGVTTPASCDIPLEGDAVCGPNGRYLDVATSVVAQFGLEPSTCFNSTPDLLVVQSLVLLAMGASAIVLVPLGDKLGRKPLLLVGGWLFALSTVLASFSPTYMVYVVATVVKALALTMMLVPACVTAAELMPTGYRHYLALSQVIAFALGGASSAVIAYFLIASWRSLTLFTAIPLTLMSGVAWIAGVLVESPKWLASKGRMEDAYDIWSHIALYNNIPQKELITLDEFIKSEVENTRATIISTPEELDEELSIMSVQYLASPDSVLKACSNFPTSVWMGCLLWAWVAAGSVYSGMWHHRYAPIIDELFNPQNVPQALTMPQVPNAPQAPAGPPQIPAPQQIPAHARLLQAAPAIQNPLTAKGLAPPPVAPKAPEPAPQQPQAQAAPAQAAPAQAAPPPSPQGAAQAPGQAAQQQAPPQPTQPYNGGFLQSIADPHKDMSNPASIIPQNMEDNAAAIVKFIGAPDPHEYFDSINHYLRNGSSFLMDRAKLIPQKAHEFYDTYELDKMIDDMRRDFKSQERESMMVYQAVRKFHEKSRIEMLFTTMTYILDLPCALMVIFLSGRQWCGRKGAILAYCFAAGCMIIASDVVLVAESTRSVLPVSMAVTGRAMLSAVYHMLFVYTSECVPTSVRCGCIGVLLAFSCLSAGIILPLAGLIDTKLREGTMFFIGGTAIIASLLGTTILPDTLGLPLCDTLEIQEVMYENLGYHDAFFRKRLHRVVTFVYQKLCCFNACFSARATRRSSLNNTLEAKGRSWLKSKINNKSRKHLFQLLSPKHGDGYRNDTDLSLADTN